MDRQDRDCLLSRRQNRCPTQGAVGCHQGAHLMGHQITRLGSSGRNQLGRPTQARQHGRQEGVTQLLSRCTGIHVRQQRQWAYSRGMSAGHTQLPHQQVADHRLCPGQGIHPPALAVVLQQGRRGGLIGKAGHHGHGRGAAALKLATSVQQQINAVHATPTRTARPLLQMYPEGLRRDHFRTHGQTQAEPCRGSHLAVAFQQFRLQATVQQQTQAMAMVGPQGCLALAEAIQRPNPPCSGCGHQASTGMRRSARWDG